MTTKLFIQALTKFTVGLIIVGLLLFLPAGTFAYWQAWLFIGFLFVPIFLSMPLVLNSVWSFALMLLYIPIIVKRIRNEEVVLERDLAGYTEYKQRVRYRLIPYIW